LKKKSVAAQTRCETGYLMIAVSKAALKAHRSPRDFF